MENKLGMISREEFEKLYPGPDASPEEVASQQRRMAEMDARDRNVQALMRKNRTTAPVTGKAGLDTMMALGALAGAMSYHKASAATVKKGKKDRNRKRNTNAAASRRKNRR